MLEIADDGADRHGVEGEVPSDVRVREFLDESRAEHFVVTMFGGSGLEKERFVG